MLASLDEHLDMKGFTEVLADTRPRLSETFNELLDSR